MQQHVHMLSWEILLLQQAGKETSLQQRISSRVVVVEAAESVHLVGAWCSSTAESGASHIERTKLYSEVVDGCFANGWRAS